MERERGRFQEMKAEGQLANSTCRNDRAMMERKASYAYSSTFLKGNRLKSGKLTERETLIFEKGTFASRPTCAP